MNREFLVEVDSEFSVEVDRKFLVEVNSEFLVKVDRKFLVEVNSEFLVEVDREFLVEVYIVNSWKRWRGRILGTGSINQTSLYQGSL